MADLLDSIRKFEGYNPRAYPDHKQYSIGYGTRAQHPNEVIGRDEAESRLQTEVSKARAIVDRFAPNADEGTKNALTSLTYNAGDEWTRSGLGQAIQAGDTDKAKSLFLQYNKASGSFNQGLADRRAAEAEWMGQQPATAAQTTSPLAGVVTSSPVSVADATPTSPPMGISPAGNNGPALPQTAPQQAGNRPGDELSDLLDKLNPSMLDRMKSGGMEDDMQPPQIPMGLARRPGSQQLMAALSSRAPLGLYRS